MTAICKQRNVYPGCIMATVNDGYMQHRDFFYCNNRTDGPGLTCEGSNAELPEPAGVHYITLAGAQREALRVCANAAGAAGHHGWAAGHKLC